jgi:hypothetical protein
MVPEKRTLVLPLILEKLMAGGVPDHTRTLTSPSHEWLLFPSDPQRVAQIPPPEQRVSTKLEQRVTTSIPDVTPALAQVTDALLKTAAPLPTT